MRSMFSLSALALTLVVGACSVPAPRQAGAGGVQDEAGLRGSASNISVDQLKAELDAGKVPLLIDVRTEREYAAGHVEGARLLPLDQLPSRIGELEAHKDQPIHVICQSGGRSARATQVLADAGFNAVNVQGGTGGWIRAGHPVTR